MKQEEKKKTAIITGSGRGIGKETAIILAKKSVNVAICSRTQSEISSVVEHINKITSNSSTLGIKSERTPFYMVEVFKARKYLFKKSIKS